MLQCHVFYGICAFVLRCFFFCSQTVLQMEHSLGVKKFFSSSLSSCKKLYFLNTLSPVLSTPLSYVCCVCMDRLMANFAGTCTSDNKGLLLLLLRPDDVINMIMKHISVTGQGAFLAPPAVCVVRSFSTVRDRCNQHWSGSGDAPVVNRLCSTCSSLTSPIYFLLWLVRVVSRLFCVL